MQLCGCGSGLLQCDCLLFFPGFLANRTVPIAKAAGMLRAFSSSAYFEALCCAAGHCGCGISSMVSSKVAEQINKVEKIRGK